MRSSPYIATISIALALAMGGCVSRTTTANVATTGLVVGGAGGLGYALSKGNPAITAATAVGGLALKSYADHVQDKQKQAELKQAFEAGQSYATKSMYDALQRQQAEPVRQQEPTDGDNDATYLPITAPRRTVKGVIIEPTTEYVRINDKS